MALVTKFLTGVRGYLLSQDVYELRNWLKIEPASAGTIYFELARELKTGLSPKGDALAKLVDKCLPEEDDVPEGKGSPWPGLNSFMKEYLEYWRDTDFHDLVSCYQHLSSLLNACANAFANPTYGMMMLQTAVSISESLSRVIMTINRQPNLLARIQNEMSTEEGMEKKSIVELAADLIQKMFTSCLTDRTSGRYAHPKGKKTAVYTFANITLKLLFACGKSRIAVQMLTNLAAQGPALSLFPASQRVTFLYYLGRFNFDHCDYFRAHLCLQEAYRQCRPEFTSHRRRILTYWIPSNLMLARFPGPALLQRPEAHGFADIYLPLCHAARTGNFVTFQHAMRRGRPYLWARGLYLHLTNLKPLVWRSFTRRIFRLTWTMPPDAAAAAANGTGAAAPTAAPTLDLHHVAAAALHVQKRLEGCVPAKPPARRAPPPPHVSSVFMQAVTNSSDGPGRSHRRLVPPPGGPRRLKPAEGLLFGNLRPTAGNVEGVLAALVYAGLLNGYIARAQHKFGIEGARRFGGDAVRAGWPVPHESIIARLREDHEEMVRRYEAGDTPDHPGGFEDVPGWVRDVMGTTWG